MRKFVYLLSALIFAFILSACGQTGKYKELKAQNGLITISESEVSDTQAHYYYTVVDGKEIKFFLVRAEDGIVRAAFDACDVCYPEKKGYRQEGSVMVCNNCGQKFDTSRINEVKGGCNPSPLNRGLDGKQITIKVDDIRSGGMYF
ncbi:MAG: Fe-S-containing protein [Deferribacterales bacterium]